MVQFSRTRGTNTDSNANAGRVIKLLRAIAFATILCMLGVVNVHRFYSLSSYDEQFDIDLDEQFSVQEERGSRDAVAGRKLHQPHKAGPSTPLVEMMRTSTANALANGLASPQTKPPIKSTPRPTVSARPTPLPTLQPTPKVTPKPTEEEQSTEKNKKRLNVALFYADDWTMKVLGKLDPLVKTPNIDAMADNGIIFTNNCVTTSVCWSSRSTLATGTYNAIHKHNMPFQEAEFESKVWPETLYPLMKRGSRPPKYDRENKDEIKKALKITNNKGYFTGLFGKWHKLEVDEELRAGFHERRIYYGHHYEKRDEKMQHVTELNKADSIWFLDKWNDRREKRPNQPFFLTTSFFATHARDGEFPSYQPQNSTRLNVYPDSMYIPKPKTATEKHFKELPEFLQRPGNEGRTRWRKRFDPDFFHSNIRDIYAMATEVDEAVGVIIEKIKSLGELDNTLLIFTTDNGNMHGEHGLAEKWYPFEESIRVPLVIQDPRMPKNRRGTTSTAWTLNVDLAPTILAAAEIEPSDFMQGRDIAQLYRNVFPDQAEHSIEEMQEVALWRKDWFYEFNLGDKMDGSDHPWKNYIDASFALVTDEWKYIYWPQHNYEQLFHRSVDPFDEWDLLNKILRAGDKKWAPNATRNLTAADDAGNIQTTNEIYEKMKARYEVMKEKALKGERI